MKNKKFFKLLRVLNDAEILAFGQFLGTDFFNKNKKIIALWDIVKDYAPDFVSETLADYATYESVYKHPPTLEAAFRATTALLKDFLAHKHLKNSYFFKRHFLSEELLRRKELEEFKLVYQATTRHSENLVANKNDRYLPEYLMAYNEVDYLSQSGGDVRKMAEKVKETLEKLDRYYLVQKLILSAELKNLGKVSVIADDTSQLLPTIDQKLREGWHKENQPIKMLHLGYRLITEGNDDDFFDLLELLDEKGQELGHRQFSDVCSMAANYAIKRIREGADFYPHLFSIYQSILKSHSVRNEDYLPHTFFKNLVTVGCRLKQFSSTRQLILDYRHMVAPDYEASAFHFNMGIVFYFEKKYDLAIKQFNQAQNHKTIYSYEAQIILLKIYFLKDEILAFPALLKAFNTRVRMAKGIGKQRKKGYLNFCRVIGPIFKLKTNPNYRKKKEDIEKLVEKFPSAGNTSWLKDQLKILKDT